MNTDKKFLRMLAGLPIGDSLSLPKSVYIRVHPWF